VNLTRSSARLQAAGRVHGLTPEIIDELPTSDDTGDNGPGVKANSKFEV